MDCIADQVLSPWTDVMVQDMEQAIDVNVWGRTYSFAQAPLPTSILTQGEKILASPIRLAGAVDGKEISWKRKGVSLFSSNKVQATLFGWQANDSISVKVSFYLCHQ